MYSSVVFLLVGCAALVSGQIECGENEVVNPCPPINCPPGMACAQVCRPRCECREGYIRNEFYECVPKVINGWCLGRNTWYTSCVNACRNTCSEPNREDSCRFTFCNPGCDCIDGYVLNEFNECILPQECPQQVCTKPNEEFHSCRTSQTCQGIFSGGPLILPRPAVCKPDCKCKLGYVRDEDNICVRPRGCCRDPFSRFQARPNPCPGGTCARPEFSPCRMAFPPYGCQCLPGYVKIDNTDKTCIPQWACDLPIDEEEE